MMGVQNNFRALVRHEFKWSRYLNNNEGKNRLSRWTLFYIALAVALGVAFFTYIATRPGFQPQYMWYFTFWLPWMAFGFAIHIVGREWQHHTFGWWLALPYSRMKLAAAKFVAIFLQATIFYCGAFAFIILLALYYQLLPGHHPFDMATFLLWGLHFFVLFISIFPLMAAIGILIGVLSKSRNKAILPLCGISLGIAWLGFNWLLSVGDGGNSIYTALSEPNGTVYFSPHPLLVGGIVVSWLMTGLMITYASRVLERQLNL